MKAIRKLSTILSQRGLSQRKAARAIGISGPYLSMILGGKRRPEFEVMGKIKVWSGGLVDYEDWEDRKALSMAADRS